MIKTYRKSAAIKAEKFDSSDEMMAKYGLLAIFLTDVSRVFKIPTIEGEKWLNLGDWIVTDVNGDQWAIADDVFKRKYVGRPTIPAAVSDWIKICKRDQQSLSYAMDPQAFPETVRDYFRDYKNFKRWIDIQENFARAWLDGYQIGEGKE